MSSAKRSAIAPEVPTIAETTGMKDSISRCGSASSRRRRRRPPSSPGFNSEINKALNDPDTRQKLVEAGAEVDPMSVAQVRAFVDGESAKYARIIKETGGDAE